MQTTTKAKASQDIGRQADLDSDSVGQGIDAAFWNPL
jgi:hypothetical protein